MALALADLTQVEQLGDDAALEYLRDGWNQLAGNVPFRRFEWLTTWWRHYRQLDWKLFVITVREADGQLIGLAPWYWSRSPRGGRVLKFLGGGEVCSDHLTLLAAEGSEATVATHVADWLTNEARRQWDSLELLGLDAGDRTIELFSDHLEHNRYGVHRRPGLNCWRVEFPDCWESYVASLSKSRRERVHRLLRQNFNTGRVTTGMVECPDELEHYFDQLVELHQKRRASLGQEGCFASPRFTAFHRDVMAQLLSLGLLRLWWTKLDGRPAAIEYDLIGGDTIYFYQSGIEPELAGDRPGWLGSIGSLRDAQRCGFRHFDFLRGDEAYKSSWKATVLPAEEIRIVAPRSIPRLRYAAWQTGQLVRQLAKIGWQTARRPKNSNSSRAEIKR